MTNHMHLLITPSSESGISALMQYVGRVYVRYFNDRYKRTGTFLEARFKSTVIDSDRYLLICYCYIELNPMRAAMVEKAEEYPYSSFACNAQGVDDDLIKPSDIHRLTDASVIFWLSPDQQPGARHLMKIKNTLKLTDHACIFLEHQLKPAYIDRLTEGLNVGEAVRDPMARDIPASANGYPQFLRHLGITITHCLTE